MPAQQHFMTASSLASEYFRKELGLHETSHEPGLDTVVIIHDACYGHRFSRRKTTKSNLDLIVERPERIQAGVLGISSAYVRMGGRHAGGMSAKESSSARRNIPFSIRRTSRSVRLQSPIVTSVHGTKWMEELNTMCGLAESRLALGDKELARTNDVSVQTPKPHLHDGDLYLAPESLQAFQGALGGVLDGVDEVFKGCQSTSSGSSGHKKAFVCIRPPGHHCSVDLPSGFCWLNNVHVGIEHAAQTHGLTHAAIIDFDLHHGDGSQSIAWERNDKAVNMPRTAPMSKKTSIGYFSLHDINSYPCEDGDIDKVQSASLCIENAHGQSIWNVHLQPWKTHAGFWELYESRYTVLLDKARAFLRAQSHRIATTPLNVRPKAAIFISAGFDASEWELDSMQRHKVNVPTEFYARFTHDINRLAEEEGTAVEGRVISILEGGYSDRALTSGVLSHLTGLVGDSEGGVRPTRGPGVKDDSAFPTEWWSAEAMCELENLVKPAQAPPKKQRLSEPTFHATPTESFLAKVVDPAKVQRKPPPSLTSSSGPSVVDIDWATAAYELSKILIPGDRQVNSCRAEELAESRVKRDRQSLVGLPTTELAADRMQLRDRKARTQSQPGSPVKGDAALPVRGVPKKSRKSVLPEISPHADNRLASASSTTPASAQPSSEGTSVPLLTLTENVHSVTSSFEKSRATKPPKSPRGATKVHRTRRVSGALPDLMASQPDFNQPPVPTLPTQFSSDQNKSVSQLGRPTNVVISGSSRPPLIKDSLWKA